MKKSFANPSKSVLALIIIIMLGGLFAQVNAQTAPSTYSAYTGTDAKAVPPAPALGPANSVVTDPTFGSKILRVTDANTNGGESFISTDAGDIRAWNANSTAIKLTGPHGDGYWLEFDPTNFKVGDGSANPKIHSVPFGATWEWSAVDPDTIYYLHGNKIAKYNKSTGVTTDLGGPSTGEAVDYMAVVVGQDNWVCAAAGPGQQDTYTKIFCLNPISPSTSKYIDVVNKTINGVPQSDPGWPTSAAGQTLGIHGMSGGTGANWVPVTFHQQSWGGNGDAVFDLATNTWSCLTNADIYWGGHTSMGNGTYANASGSQDGKDSRGMLLRNPDAMMNTSQYKFVGQPPAPSNGWCDADHNSWQNSLSNPNAPIFQSRYGGSSGCAFAWTGEIIGIAVDGSNTVWRFAHNHNNGFQCYYGQAFAQVSNDGKWALFSSYWDGALGADTAFGCTSRIDTFIVALTPGAPGSTGGTSAGSTGTSTGSTGTSTGSTATSTGSTGTSAGNSGSSASSGGTSGTGTSGTSGTGTSNGTPTSGPNTVEQSSAAVQWSGTWSINDGTFNSGGSAKLSMAAKSRATFSFTGTAVKWIAYRDQGSGIANVYIDGTLASTVDTYSSSAQSQTVAYTASGLSLGTHSIAIEVTGTKNASSGGSWIWVDRFDYFGAPLGAVTPATASATTSPASGKTLTSSGAGSLSVASAEVDGSGGPAPSGVAMVSNRPNGVMVSEAGVPASVPVLKGRVDAEIGTAARTGFSVANPNDSQATVSFFFTDSNGTDSGAGSLTLPPHGQIARFLNEAPFNGPASFSGTLTFTSNVPVSAVALYGLLNERSEFLMTTLPIANPDQPSPATAFFPHVVSGAGWSTQFVLMNPTDGTIAGSLNFINQAGQAVSQVPYQIAARSAWRYTTPDSASLNVDFAIANPAQSNMAPVGVAIISERLNGITVSQAGVPSLETGAAFRMFTETSAGGTIRTGVAVANPSPIQTTVEFDLTGLDGTSTGLKGTVSIPAFGQRSLFIDEIPGFDTMPKPFKGFVRIFSQDGVDLAVIGLRGRLNERSEYLMTTTAPTNENSSAAPQIVFPQVVNGGGFLTEFVLYNGVPGEPSNSNVDVRDQSGASMNMTLQ